MRKNFLGGLLAVCFDRYASACVSRRCSGLANGRPDMSLSRRIVFPAGTPSFHLGKRVCSRDVLETWHADVEAGVVSQETVRVSAPIPAQRHVRFSDPNIFPWGNPCVCYLIGHSKNRMNRPLCKSFLLGGCILQDSRFP